MTLQEDLERSYRRPPQPEQANLARIILVPLL